MREALGRIRDFNERAGRLGAEGHREYHSGWHTAIDVRNLLSVSEAIHALRDRAQGEPVATSARTIPQKAAEFGTFNIVVKQAGDARCRCRAYRFRRCRTT